ELAPRFGFAYTPRPLGRLERKLFGSEQTVIRGGAAISYDATNYQYLADIQASAPNSLLAVLGPAFAAEAGRLDRVISAAELQGLIGRDPRAYARTQVASGFQSPYAARWHLAAGRNLDDRITIEAAYVGTKGFDLIRLLDGRPAVPLSGNSPPRSGPLRIY